MIGDFEPSEVLPILSRTFDGWKAAKSYARIERPIPQGLKPETVERAIQLSHEKYCSASIMLAKTAKLSHDFEIFEADAEPDETG